MKKSRAQAEAQSREISRSRVPPRLATRLLGFCFEAEERSAVTQEWAELFQMRCGRSGLWAARVWYWRQMASLCVGCVRQRFFDPGNRHLLSGASSLSALPQDLRLGLRSYFRDPGLTLVATLTLGLGIGANAAVFSVVDGVLLKALPYPGAERLTRLFMSSPPNRWSFSAVDFSALREQSKSFASLAAYTYRGMIYSDGESAERVIANRVTSDFFKTLAVEPALGRGFLEGEDAPGQSPVVIVSHGFWQASLGGTRDALGRSVNLDGENYTVVGIMAPRVGPIEGQSTDLWPILRIDTPTRRGPFFLRPIARLKESITHSQAEEELQRICRSVFPDWRETYQDEKATWVAVSLRDFVVGDLGTPLTLLSAAVALVLFIACTNIANLLLVRASGRSREVAIRSALGASRWRIAQRNATEGLVLAGMGGILGLFLGHLLVQLLLREGPVFLPRIDEVGLDGRVLAYITGACLIAAFFFSLAPGLASDRSDLRGSLHDAGRSRSESPRSRRVRGVLIVVQFALALPLLVAAGLMIQSFIELQRVDLGFEPDRVASLRVALPRDRYSGAARINSFWDRTLAEIEAIPGIEAAGLCESRPPQELQNINNFDLVSKPTPPGESQPTSPWIVASPGYFKAMGIPLIRGRLLQKSDRVGSPQVVVVDQNWAQQHFPDGDALGEEMRNGGCRDCPTDTIVGIVGNVKYTGLAETDGAIYVPHAQSGYANMYLFVRVERGNSEGRFVALRKVIHDQDPLLALSDFRTGEQLVGASTSRERYLMSIVGLFALIALVLASVGVYGVVSYDVQKRTTDIGVRMALGGSRREVIRWVLGQGLRPASLGICLGLIVSYAFSGLLSGLLFRIPAFDPVTFLALSLLLGAVALFACCEPARRATRIDPIEALRHE